MTTYEKTTDTQFTVTARQRVTERHTTTDPEPEEDPRPSFPPLRVVTVDGEAVEESTLPIAKCRQITPVRMGRKVAG